VASAALGKLHHPSAAGGQATKQIATARALGQLIDDSVSEMGTPLALRKSITSFWLRPEGYSKCALMVLVVKIVFIEK
jgi:hypothetical protein